MNELFDKLILRIVFTIFICILLVIYKYIHVLLYPSYRLQLLQRFYPTKNSANTIHFFSRLIGLAIIFSEFYFYLSNGIGPALVEFFLQASFIFIIYLISLFIMESIVLYNFEYNDEVIKKKNYAYAIICFANSTSIAYVLKIAMMVSKSSLILLLLLWLFSLVIIGLATKSFSIISKLSFNKLIIQKNVAVAFSYFGFIWGWALIVSSSLNHEVKDIKWYAIQVILKILLSVIIFPIFKKGITLIFKIQEDFSDELSWEKQNNVYGPELGQGIYEGVSFLTSCFLTTVITGHINFGTFYPIF